MGRDELKEHVMKLREVLVSCEAAISLVGKRKYNEVQALFVIEKKLKESRDALNALRKEGL